MDAADRARKEGAKQALGSLRKKMHKPERHRVFLDDDACFLAILAVDIDKLIDEEMRNA